MQRREFIATSAAWLAGIAIADDADPFYDGKLENDKAGDVHDFLLGVLSAVGRVKHGDKEVVVRDVGAGGAADRAGLKAQDVITHVEAKPLLPYSKELDTGFQGPEGQLAAALDEKCAAKKPLLKLTLRRDGKPLPLDVALPPSPAFDKKAFPQKCAKAANLRQACREWLVKNQTEQGIWPGHIGGDSREYQAATVGLGLLSANNRDDVAALKKTAAFLQAEGIAAINLDDPTKGPKNWIAAMSGIFLAEYYLATLDEAVKPGLQKCCDLLAKRVSVNGRMGHHMEVTYGGGGLTIVNAHAHLCWALAAKCDVRVDKAAWDRSMGEIVKAVTPNGAIGYSSAAKGDNDAPARTGGMAAALVLWGQAKMAAPLGNWLIERNNRLTHAHTNAAMGLAFATCGIKLANPKQLGKHLLNWLPYFELSRSAAGPAAYNGSKRNFGGDQYLGLTALANATVSLMLASPEDHLFLLGGKTKGWMTK